jgi:hypothetical protein
MSGTIYWLQLGGMPVVNDDQGLCQWPSHPMIPPSAAESYGYNVEEGVPWNGPTTGHRGHGVFANERILDFRDPKDIVYCRPLCLTERPRSCLPEDKNCPVFIEDIQGHPNQVGLNYYYCKTMRPKLKVGDCIATHLVPAKEKFTDFVWSVTKPTPGVMGKFKLMAANTDLTGSIDFGQTTEKMQCVDIKDIDPDLQFSSLCDGYDVILFEIEAMPDDIPAEDCRPASGRLDNFVLTATVNTMTVKTGK